LGDDFIGISKNDPVKRIFDPASALQADVLDRDNVQLFGQHGSLVP
jgi:hypothetical protein